MSVINAALTELENRGSGFKTLRPETTVSDKNRSNPERNKRLWLVGFVVLIVVIVLVISRQIIVDQAEQIESQTAPAVQSLSDSSEEVLSVQTQLEPKPAVELEASLMPRQVAGLQLRENNDSLQLSLRLPQAASVVLSRRTERQFEFSVFGYSGDIVLPDVSGEASINDLSLELRDEQPVILIATAADILLETEDVRMNDQFVWKISLSQRKSTIPVELANSKEKQLAATSKSSAPADTPRPVQTVIVNSPDNSIQNLKIEKLDSQPSDTALVQRASELMQNAAFAEAEQVWLSLLGGSQNREASLALLKLYAQQQRFVEYDGLMHQQQFANDLEFVALDAQTLYQRGLFRQLVQRYQSQASLPVINLLAAAYQQLGEYPAAIKQYQRSLAVDPQQAKRWLSMAIVFDELGQKHEALLAYREAQKVGLGAPRLQDYALSRVQALELSTAQ